MEELGRRSQKKVKFSQFPQKIAFISQDLSEKKLVKVPPRTRLILNSTMIKCHCAEVFFEEILNVVKETNRPILEVAKEMGAADTCTACVGDMLQFIQNELEGLELAGHSTYR